MPITMSASAMMRLVLMELPRAWIRSFYNTAAEVASIRHRAVCTLTDGTGRLCEFFCAGLVWPAGIRGRIRRSSAGFELPGTLDLREEAGRSATPPGPGELIACGSVRFLEIAD